MSQTAQTKTQFKGVLMLMLTAFIWGTSFVAQSVGMESIEGFTFSGIRTLMGSLVLLPVVLLRNHLAKRGLNPAQLAQHKARTKKTIAGGAVLGVVLCAAANFQQFAFNYSSSGKIAFITALYMFFVPLFGLFLKKKVPALTWICTLLGFVGLSFLCINPSDLGALNRGDVLTFICSMIFAIHILLIEKFAPDADGVMLSCVQFAVSGTISCILMFLFETPRMDAILVALPSLLYSGVMSCGLAYTFQIIGQKYTEATVASLIMCLESVFGVLAGAVILHEVLTGREIVGCVIMFAAILLSQVSDLLTEKFRQRKKVSP